MNNSQTISNSNYIGPPEPGGERNHSIPKKDGEPLLQRLEKIASLSQILRAFGACAIVASMSLFMMQGWAEGNDITRYLKLLAQTGLLTGAGLMLSILIKEFKGARVFFGLALISVVANFTILGSLTYSLFPMDVQIVDYPDSMKWEVSTAAIFFPVFLGALSLLSAVTYFGFSIFSRQIAKPLTLGLLTLSTALLLPVRAPLVAVGLSAITLWGAWLLIQRLRKIETLVMTNETKVSLCLLLLPGLIILARAVSFYNIDQLTILAFSALVFLAFRNISGLLDVNNVFKRLIDVLLFALGAFIAVMTTQVLPVSWNSVDMLIGGAMVIGFALEQLLSTRNKQWKAIVINITTIALVPIALFNATIDYELTYSLQALLVCGLSLVLSIKAGDILGTVPFSRIIAILGVLSAAIIVLFDLVQLVQLGNWVIIGLCGATLIIGASLYERFGLKLLSK